MRASVATGGLSGRAAVFDALAAPRYTRSLPGLSAVLLPSGHRAEPALPHERDETVGMTGGIADPVIRQAHRDLEHGIDDTSRSNETDRASRKLKQ